MPQTACIHLTLDQRLQICIDHVLALLCSLKVALHPRKRFLADSTESAPRTCFDPWFRLYSVIRLQPSPSTCPSQVQSAGLRGKCISQVHRTTQRPIAMRANQVRALCLEKPRASYTALVGRLRSEHVHITTNCPTKLQLEYRPLSR